MFGTFRYWLYVKRASERGPEHRSVAAAVEARIGGSGDRLWSYADFSDLPFTAVSQTLSRLTRKGRLARVRKGLYYTPRRTVLGPSRPSRSSVAQGVVEGGGL